MRSNLGSAYTHTRNLSKAKMCYEEALKELIELRMHYPHLIIAINMELANNESCLGYRELSKSRNELIFAKHFLIMQRNCPDLAVGLIDTIAKIYMEEFNVEAATDTLELRDKLFYDNRSYIIVRKGQLVVDREISILSIRIKYDICKAIISSSDQERIKKLEQFYSVLVNKRLNSLTANSSKPLQDSYLLHTTILLKNPPNDKIIPNEKAETTLKKIDSLDFILSIKYCLMTMNILVFKFQTSLPAEEKCKHKNELYKTRCNIVSIFQKLAEIEFLKKNFDLASLLMRRAYLCESLADLLQFRMRKKLLKIEIKGMEIERILFPIVKISDEDLIQYMRQRFNSKCSSSENNNVIRQYKKTKGDQKLIQKLISEYEKKVTLSEKLVEKMLAEEVDNKNDDENSLNA